jgi:hypothetical protein
MDGSRLREEDFVVGIDLRWTLKLVGRITGLAVTEQSQRANLEISLPQPEDAGTQPYLLTHSFRSFYSDSAS